MRKSQWVRVRLGRMAADPRECELQYNTETGHYRTLIPVHARYSQELYGDRLVPTTQTRGES
jgi:hypothetical protein